MATSKRTSTAASLHKGRACINCRRRKIKCDGEKPSCSACRSSQFFHDCEYSSAGFTRTQILEEKIAILEARLEEIEHPNETAASLTLHDPYQQQSYSPEPERSAASTPSTKSSISESAIQDLPKVVHDALIHTFLHHCTELCFFLDVQRFINAAETKTISPSLLNAAYLWGAHLSTSTELCACDVHIVFAARAVQATSQALHPAEGQAPQILECIQAEVLLALYFFRNGRLLEGKYHTGAAVSLALTMGLHKISSASKGFHTILDSQSSIFPPVDTVEENERINAFWVVLTLNNCWNTVDGSPSAVAYDAATSRVDTPWPVDLSADSRLRSPSSHTIQRFLANDPRDDGTSVLALYAKATILFEQSARLVQHYHEEMSPEDMVQFGSAFTSLNNVISRFLQVLPNAGVQFPPSVLLAIATLSNVAALQLHQPFIAQDPASHERFVESAKSIVHIMKDLRPHHFTIINPIMGPLWGMTCRIFVAEILRYRGRRRTEALSFDALQNESNLFSWLQAVMHGMAVFAGRCHLMESQLLLIQSIYPS
ncbi:Zn(2)-Cys(6) binuclear cluster domain-containing protein [Mycena floridula]|nr:Zn(2)-Cys(6) binuclear cluster domain-containing protein [Mycena floridula]